DPREGNTCGDDLEPHGCLLFCGVWVRSLALPDAPFCAPPLLPTGCERRSSWWVALVRGAVSRYAAGLQLAKGRGAALPWGSHRPLTVKTVRKSEQWLEQTRRLAAAMEALAELLGESPAINIVRRKLRQLLEGQPAG